MKRIVNTFIILVIFIFLMLPKNTNDLKDNDIILGDTNLPRLITPTYSTDHFIVADYVLNPSSNDMSDSIQNTLNTCYKNGGGTVWLNKGIYYVSKPIDVPTGCTLMGDWQDPDNYSGTLDYGTKIVVNVNNFKRDNSDDERSGLFRMHSSSGVEGLTIYYKGQNINNPISQPWTFYCTTLVEDLEEPGKSPGMLFTVKNITMINSYYGIGRSSFEIIGSGMLMVENVKGTVLKKGAQYHNSGEVSTITGLNLKPKYWASANLNAFNDNVGNISESTIINKIKSIGGIGLSITDAELSEYVNVNITGYKYGIYVPKRSTISARAVGSGAFYNLNISNTSIGIFVDSDGEGKKPTVSSGIGYVISNSTIEGSDYSIYISAPLESGKRGTIKLNNVSLKGKIGGNGGLLYYDNSSKNYKSVYSVIGASDAAGKINNNGKFTNINISRKLKNNGDYFIVVNPGCTVDTLNGVLSSVSQNGGGVVYLKPGRYNVDKTIIIPDNVELRGSFASPSYKAGKRNGNGDGILLGTILHVNTGVNAVKINGNNSGVSGIYFMYESNVRNLGNYKEYPYTIETINTKNIYIKNITICGATHGININKVDGFTIQNLVTGIISNTIKIDNSNNGLILNSLENGWVSDWNLLYYGSTNLNNISKKKLSHLLVHNTQNLDIQNTFAYGANTFLTTSNSKLYLVNVGYDGLDNIFLHESNTTLTSVNAFVYGNNLNTLIKISGGSIGLYNNYNMNNIEQNDYEYNIKTSNNIVGDINGDGKVNTSDYILIRKHLIGIKLTGDSLSRADVNKDGKINSLDYIQIRKKIIGII